MFGVASVFILIAFLYASVGFGGGSSYTAILIESGLDWQLVPPISLLCNLIVVSGGVYHFSKSGHLDLKLALPLLVTSVPAAFVGGYLHLEEPIFLQILGFALLASGVLMLFDRRWIDRSTNSPSPGAAGLAGMGLVLGALAGVTGIGGGIYLAPVLHLCRLAPARTTAATCSLFILVNSLAGLAGQVSKLGAATADILSMQLLILPVAVLIGGQLGSRFGARRLPAAPIRRLTGLVVLVVAIRILWQVSNGAGA